MGIKCYDHELQLALSRQFPTRGEHLLVAKVYAIKIPDAQHGSFGGKAEVFGMRN